MKPRLGTKWYVYIVRCADGSLYCGITKDLMARVQAHNAGRYGAAYTRSRRPVQLVYAEWRFTKRFAMQRERAIKDLTKTQKEAIIRTNRNNLGR